jgi:HAD superfamily phosphoserine phosphatase-like hydrolase
MSGAIALEAVYKQRLELIRPSRAAVLAVGKLYVERALPHARELVSALRALGKRVCVVSGGLEPAVRQLACALGFDKRDVFSVGIRHDAKGNYAGFDELSPLGRSGGKVTVVRALASEGGPVAFVGDGITDLETVLEPGCAARFVAYGGVARRAEVFERARQTCAHGDLAALLPLLASAKELELLAQRPEHAALVEASRKATAS